MPFKLNDLGFIGSLTAGSGGGGGGGGGGGHTIAAVSAAQSDVQNAVNKAQPGDTVTVPGQTATWTLPVTINKAISVIGATTVDYNSVDGTKAYPAAPFSAATDRTLITRSSGGSKDALNTFAITASNGQVVRLSGFTFLPGTGMGLNGCIRVDGTAVDGPTSGVRIDNCHFNQINQSDGIRTFGCVFGVFDHNLVEGGRQATSIIWHSSYLEPGGIGDRTNGDGSWADVANWGSYKFWFFENNILHNTVIGGATTNCNVDSKRGARYVFRYNKCFESVGANTHGTEGAGVGERGCRAVECYNNTFFNTTGHGCGQMRSGNIYFHDNNYYGVVPDHGVGLRVYREGSAWAGWGGAQGSNPWDHNDPVLYASGVHSGATSGNGTTVSVLNVSGSPGWTTNQWALYELTNLDQAVAKRSSNYNSQNILSNTDHTITCVAIGTPEFQPGLIWQAGNRFEVRRVISALDQAGRGKGDYITFGDHPTAGNSLGSPSLWPNQVVEPSYSWNNRFPATGAHINVSGGAELSVQANRDFYVDTNPGYTTFQYPHPLTLL